MIEMTERVKPLTDPTDIVTLLGRFASSAALCVLTLVLLVKGYYAVGAAIAVVSLFFQRATVKLWRRLRDERMAAEVERARQTAPPEGAPISSASGEAQI